MNRPCLVCGVPTQGARCDEHRLPRAPKAPREARGYGERWRKLSKLARMLSPVCAHCGALDDLTADHLHADKVALTLDDVQVLCRRCNAMKGKPGGQEPPKGVSSPTRPHRQNFALRGPA